ncbi:PAS domain S-box protein [Thioclava sp. FR2]|uniref:PAS domain S-box protein n=1 Tax=Thioclava sp. FR2 TaxID=3445780 RepID=UPI003EBEAA4F
MQGDSLGTETLPEALGAGGLGDDHRLMLSILDAGLELSKAGTLGVGSVVNRGLEAISFRLGCALRVQLGAHRFGPDFAGKPLLNFGAAQFFADRSVAFSQPVREAFERYAHAALGLLHQQLEEGDLVARLISAETSKREAETRLDRRSTLMQALFDLSPIGVILLDFDSGKVLNANKAFLDFGRWQPDEVLGRGLRRIMPASARQIRRHALRSLLQEDRFGPVLSSFERPDGSVCSVVVRGISWPGPDKARWVWLLVEDVTSQQQAISEAKAHRDAAVQARAELDAALEALPHGFVLFDSEDRVALCNDNMRRIFPGMEDLFTVGMRHVDILNEGIRRGMFPEAVGREEAFIAEVERRRKERRFERLTELKSGRFVRVIEVAVPQVGRVGLRIDVTEEVLAQRRLSDVIEGSQAGTWEVDLATGVNIVNRRWATMLGREIEDLQPITSATWRGLIHPQDVAEVSASVDKLLSGELSQYDHNYRMRHADGHWVWINDRGRISGWTADGKPARMAGVHVDFSALKETEQRLEDIIDGAEVGTWQFNVSTGENIINDRWAEMLGHTRAELEPMTLEKWKTVVHPDDFEDLHHRQTVGFDQQIWQFSYELRLRHKDGHWVWVLSRGRVTAWDDDGKPLIMSGVHLDISGRKHLEMVIEAERDFLAQLMQTSVSGVIAVDEDGRVIFCNAEVAQQLEIPIEALQGQICDPTILGLTGANGESITLDDMPCKICLDAKVGRVRDVRLRLNLKDGRRKVLSINGARTQEATQDVRAVLTVTDITDAAMAEERLREARERAEAANRAKSQFLANMSHELRTPLNGVLGMVELMTGDESAEERREMLATIRTSADHLLGIVNDILDLAKVESGNVELQTRPLDLAEICHDVGDVHTVVAARKNVALKVIVDPRLAEPRLGDRQRLTQILHNALSNAVKFTERGSVTLQAALMPGDVVRFSIQDTGIGMTLEETGRVFDEFTQADGTITRKFGGTGLGLSILRRLVDLMKGKVALDSVKGQGTTLTIELPMPRAVVAERKPTAERPVALPEGRAMRALVAEDNATNQIILRSMLARLGVVTTFASNGDEAVDLWKPGAFDILLLDISMPGKDGITALQELREKSGKVALPPAIAVTANAMTHHLESYRQAGFATVVAKPIKLDDLARGIAEAALAASEAPGDQPLSRMASLPERLISTDCPGFGGG